MSLQCRKTKALGSATGPTKARWMTAATLLLTVSCVAAFSSNLSHRNSYSMQTSQRHVMTDPDALLRETTAFDKPQVNFRSPQTSQELLDVPVFKAPKKTKRNYMRTGGTGIHTEEELCKQSSAGKPVFKHVSLQRQPGKRPEAPGRVFVSRTPTMPGFSAQRPRSRDSEDCLREFEARSGKKLRRQLTTSFLLKQKKAHAEAMYMACASVPDSLVIFSKEIHKVRPQ